MNWVWTFASLVILNSYSDSLVNALILGLSYRSGWYRFFLIYRENLLLGFKCWHIAGLGSEVDCWIRSFWERRFWSTWSPVVLREKQNSRCLLEWQDGFRGFNRLVTESYFNHISVPYTLTCILFWCPSPLVGCMCCSFLYLLIRMSVLKRQ